MPQIQLPGEGNAQVGGPWGGTMYPEWFTAGIGPQLQSRGPEAIANLFADYVASHPDQDFGWYWNSFKPGGQHAANRFGSGQPNQPYGQPPTQNTPPPTNPNNPPAQNNNNHVTTSRPTTPGGPEPGHWQRLVSFVNGVRQERWEWRQDATSPQPSTTPPTTTPPTQTDPPQGETKPPEPTTKPKPNPGGWQTPPRTPPVGTQTDPPSPSPTASPMQQQGSSPTQQNNSLVSNALGSRRRPGFSTSGQSVNPNRFRI